MWSAVSGNSHSERWVGPNLTAGKRSTPVDPSLGSLISLFKGDLYMSHHLFTPAMNGEAFNLSIMMLLFPPSSQPVLVPS